MEINSPNFENNFYPDFGYIEYKLVSLNKINIRSEYFNIDSLGDMIYLFYPKSNNMKLVTSNQHFETSENEVSIVFRTDCSGNTGKFKFIVDFTRNNNQTVTQKPETSTYKPYTTEQTSTTVYTTPQYDNTNSSTSYTSTSPSGLTNSSQCSNNPIVLSGSGYVFSPNYPDQYPTGSNCKWLLKTDDGMRFKIKVKITNVYFITDYIALYNSSRVANETLIAYLKGLDQSIEIISNSSEVLIVFVSDNFQRDYRYRESFSISYTETFDPPTKTPSRGKEVSGKGIIFPKNHNIVEGLNEFNWTLKSHESKKFKLKVYVGNFFGNLNFRNNLAISDGGEQIAGLIHVDNTIEFIFYSDSSKVLINYKFDSACAAGCYFNYSSFFVEHEELDTDVSAEDVNFRLQRLPVQHEFPQHSVACVGQQKYADSAFLLSLVRILKTLKKETSFLQILNLITENNFKNLNGYAEMPQKTGLNLK